MASAHKKDFWATKVEDSLLGDQEWHSLTVCQVSEKVVVGTSQFQHFMVKTTLKFRTKFSILRTTEKLH